MSSEIDHDFKAPNGFDQNNQHLNQNNIEIADSQQLSNYTKNVNNSSTNKVEAVATTTNGTSTNKPFKTNTYMQLNIDQSNFKSLPRICKFLVTKLELESNDISSTSSVVLAVKLQVSKRSLRTLEIPLQDVIKSPVNNNNTNNNPITSSSNPATSLASIELNLNYNITYPHSLKKDANLLYIYIQKRKKFKTKPIMGYKTLAFTFIDLANVLHKPLSDNLPLYQTTSSSNNRANSQTKSKNAQNKNRKAIGSLNIESLISIPVDLPLLEANASDENTTQAAKNNLLNADEQTHLNKLDYLNRLYTANGGQPGVEASSSSSNHHPHPRYHLHGRRSRRSSTTNLKIKPENFKLITNLTRTVNRKITSFLRKKLKTDGEEEGEEGGEEVCADAIIKDGGELGENLGGEKGREEEGEYKEDEVEDEDEEEDEENCCEDLDEYYNVYNISDYYTESDEEHQEDSYSIISIPKPKLQPYFSQSYLDLLHSSQNNLHNINYNNNHNNNNNQYKFLLTDFYKTENSDHNCSNEFLTLLTRHLNCVLIHNLNEFVQFIDLANNKKQKTKEDQQQKSKIVLFCSENYLNEYLKLYMDLIKYNESIGKSFLHYVIPNHFDSKNGGHLATCLGKSSPNYSKMFLDEFWPKSFICNTTNLVENSKEILTRLMKYIKCSKEKLSLRVGEVMLNDDLDSKFIPFLIDIRIGVLQKYDDVNLGCDLEANTNKSEQQPNVIVQKNTLLSTSLSMPQFMQTLNSFQSPSSSQISSKSKFSPPNSPLTPISALNHHNNGIISSDETGYNLQLDYWTSEQYNHQNIDPNSFNSILIQHLNLNSPSQEHVAITTTTASSNNSNTSSNSNSTSSNKVNQKSSFKASFRNLHIYRDQTFKNQNNNNNCSDLTNTQNTQNDQSLVVDYSIKEKKQKSNIISKRIFCLLYYNRKILSGDISG
jgi:hypothetical protein